MVFGRDALRANANGAGFDHSIFAMRVGAQFRAPRRVHMKMAMADRVAATVLQQALTCRIAPPYSG